MKVFISWSGGDSHSVALILRDWIAVVLPYAQTWVSSEDISKGARWGVELAEELETTNCGIVCLTPFNVTEPWLNFEAGALSKTVERARVYPFLVGFHAQELVGPLSQFQATEFTRNDLQKLVRAINDSAGAAAIPMGQLDRNFQICWPDIDQRLAPILAKLTTKDTGRRAVPNLEQSATEDDLSEEDLKALRVMIQASGERVFPQQLAEAIGVHPERAKHIMEKLEGRRFLNVSYNYLHGTSWLLSRNGRAELVRRNIL